MVARESSSRWKRLDDFELRAVRRFAALGRFRSVRFVTVIVNLLADGWIYLPIAAAIYFLADGSPWRIIGQACLAALVAHAIHAPLKRGLRRQRPMDCDPLLPRSRVLDRYSFPSGHCMTLACVAVPVVHNTPWLWPAATLYVILLAACRLIAAHHYPTDVLSGIFIGLGVGSVTSAMAFIGG